MREDEGMTLSEFLLARIAEDEAWSREMLDTAEWADRQAGHPAASLFQTRGRPRANRLLAECEVRRRIVDSATDVVPAGDLAAGFDSASFNAGSAWRAHNVLRALAQPYADHADFRPEWRLPDTRT